MDREEYVEEWLRRMGEDKPDHPPRRRCFDDDDDEDDDEPEAPETAEEEAPVPTIEPKVPSREPEPPHPSRSDDLWPSPPTTESEDGLSVARGSTPSIRPEPKDESEEEEEEEKEEEEETSSESTESTCLLIGDNFAPVSPRTHSTTESEAWECDKDRYIISTGTSRGRPGYRNDIILRVGLVDETLRYDPWLPVLTTLPEDRPHSPSTSYRPPSILSVDDPSPPPTPPPPKKVKTPKPALTVPPPTPGAPGAFSHAKPYTGDPKRAPGNPKTPKPTTAEIPPPEPPAPPPSPRPRLYPLPDPTVEAAHLSVLSRFADARPSFFLLETVDPTRAMVKACRRASCTVPLNKLLHYLDASVAARRDSYVALMAAHEALREHEELWRGLERWVTLSEAPPGIMSMRRRLRLREFRVFRERAEEMVWLKWEVRRWRRLERAARRRSLRYRREAVDVQNRWHGEEAGKRRRRGGKEEGQGGWKRSVEEEREGEMGWVKLERDALVKERDHLVEEVGVAWRAVALAVGEKEAEVDEVTQMKAAVKAAEAAAEVAKTEKEAMLGEREAMQGELEEAKKLVAKLEEKAEKAETTLDLARKQVLDELAAKKKMPGTGIMGAAFDMLRNPLSAVSWGTSTEEVPKSPDRDSEGRDPINMEEEEQEEEGGNMMITPPDSPARTKENILKDLSAAEFKQMELEDEIERLEEQIETLKTSNDMLQAQLGSAEEGRAFYLKVSKEALEKLNALKANKRKSSAADSDSFRSISPITKTPTFPPPSPLSLLAPTQPTTPAPETPKRPSFLTQMIAGKRKPTKPLPSPVLTSRPTTAISEATSQASSASTVRDADVADAASIAHQLAWVREEESQIDSVTKTLGVQLQEAHRLRDLVEQQLEREKERYEKLRSDKGATEAAMLDLGNDIQQKDALLMEMAVEEGRLRVKAAEEMKELRAKTEREMAELRAKNERETAELRLKLDTQREEMKKKHKAKREKLLADAAEEREELKRKAAEENAESMKKVGEELDKFTKAVEQMRAEQDGSWTTKLDDAERRLKETEDFRAAQQAQWENERNALVAQHEQAVERLKAQHQQEAERLRAAHMQAMETLTNMYDQEIATLTAQGKKEMKALAAKRKRDLEEREMRFRVEAESIWSAQEKETLLAAKDCEHRLRLALDNDSRNKKKLQDSFMELAKLQDENDKLQADYEQYRAAHPDHPPVTPGQVEALKDMMTQAIRAGTTTNVGELMKSAKQIIPIPADALLEELVIRHAEEEQKIKALDREWTAIHQEYLQLDEEHETLVTLSEALKLEGEEAETDYQQKSEALEARREQWEAAYQARYTDLNTAMAGLDEAYRKRSEELDNKMAEYDAKMAQYDKDLEKLRRDRDAVESERERLDFLNIQNKLDEDDNQKATRVNDEVAEALNAERYKLNALEAEYETGIAEAQAVKDALEGEQERLNEHYNKKLDEIKDLYEFREEDLAAREASVAAKSAKLKQDLADFRARINRAEAHRTRMKLMLEKIAENNIHTQEALVGNSLLDLHVRQRIERLGHEICFCSLLQFYFPEVYDATVNGGCCGMREEHPVVDWPGRSIAQRQAANAAGGGESVCHGHHGHGHISAGGAPWSFLCQVLTSSVWFVFLVILQTHNLRRLLWFNLTLFAGIPLYLVRLALFGISMATMGLHLPFRPASKPALPKFWLAQRPSAAALLGVVLTTGLVLTFLSAEAVRQERMIWLRANSWRTYLVDIQQTAPYWGGWPLEVDMRLAYEPMLKWLFDGLKELMFPRKRALVEGEESPAAAVVRWFFE